MLADWCAVRRREGPRGGLDGQEPGLDPFILMKSSLLIGFPQVEQKENLAHLGQSIQRKESWSKVNHYFLPGALGQRYQ